MLKGPNYKPPSGRKRVRWWVCEPPAGWRGYIQTKCQMNSFPLATHETRILTYLLTSAWPDLPHSLQGKDFIHSIWGATEQNSFKGDIFVSSFYCITVLIHILSIFRLWSRRRWLHVQFCLSYLWSYMWLILLWAWICERNRGPIHDVFLRAKF